MAYQLHIAGMHCEACKTLIGMEIEDLGLAEKIVTTELLPDNQGIVTLKDVTPNQLEQIKTAINNLKRYRVTN